MSYYNELHDGNLTEDETEGSDDVNHNEDDSGVQEWSSKGDFYPWVWTYLENRDAGYGEFFYVHPDGRVTDKYIFDLKDEGARTRAYRDADAEVRSILKGGGN